MASYSSSSSPNSGGSVRRRNRDYCLQCSCQQRAVVETSSKPGPNFGRRFYGCQNYYNHDASRGSCKFFRWFDPINKSAETLKIERDGLEQELGFFEEEMFVRDQEAFIVRKERDSLKEEVQAMLKEIQNLSKSKDMELNKLRIANGVMSKSIVFMFVLLFVMFWRVSY